MNVRETEENNNKNVRCGAEKMINDINLWHIHRTANFFFGWKINGTHAARHREFHIAAGLVHLTKQQTQNGGNVQQ